MGSAGPSFSWSLVAPALAEPEPSAETVISSFLDQKQETMTTEKDWQTVLSQVQAALTRQPENRDLKVRALFARGQIAYLNHDLTAASGAFEAAVRLMPASPLGHLGAGHVYLARRLAPAAIESFQNVILINPKIARAYKALGDAYSCSERSTDAIRMYLRAQGLGYAGADLINMLEKNQAQILIGERRWQQAVSKLRAVAESSPSAEIYLSIGQCYEELNQMFSAAEAYTRAAQLDQQSAAAHFRLGDLLLRQREFQAAAAATERAIALDPAGTQIELQQARKNLELARKRSRSKRRGRHEG
jgi:tetratricopeptide (TPR) repeat protein